MKPLILLVDDREDNLFSMETILEQDGYDFVKANSGRQALKILLTQTDFALILMDVQMPNLNGFETATLIYEREKLRHIPIVFITAHNFGEENLFKGYKAGAVDYIFKPVNPGLLRTRVSVFIELYRKNRQLLAHEQKLTAINKSLELEIQERNASEKKVYELNRQLLQNIERLESKNKELDLFAFMASHDLQAPLRKIRLFSDRLLEQENKLSDKDRDFYLSRIQNVCSRMQQLINDLLKFSKISGDEGYFENVELQPLVTELVTDMSHTLAEKNAVVDIGPLPAVFANRSLMSPLFSNLISNALKYSKKQVQPHISIRSEMEEPSRVNKGNTTFARIFVEDNGIGFEQQYAEQVFDMFRRLHPGAEFEGTGIGLALCKRIVEKHNGFISARSKVNEGSTFIISFPLHSSQNEKQ